VSAKLYDLSDARRAKTVQVVDPRLICSKCGELCGYIDVVGFAFALKETQAKLHGDRIMQGVWISVCPICDGYLLMRDFEWGVPFYSVRDLALISIGDYDRITTVALLEFGNLPFTISALRGALHVLERSSVPVDGNRVELLDRRLLRPTGIPDDESAHGEWLRQLEKLVSNLHEPCKIARLDAAVRQLIRQLPT